jgi:hypothetical protein
MSDFENQTKTYKQYWTTPYCFRPMSSRRVNSVKELNRLMERIAELEAAIKTHKESFIQVGMSSIEDKKLWSALGDEAIDAAT